VYMLAKLTMIGNDLWWFFFFLAV